MENWNKITLCFVMIVIGTGLAVMPHKVYGQTPQANLTLPSTPMNNTSPVITLKHPSIMSVLTVTPYPTVKQNENVNIKGKLIDGITLAPIPASPVKISGHFISLLPPALTPINSGSLTTDSDGNFTANIPAPNQQGSMIIKAEFSGNGNYYPIISLPQGVLVTK